jgi:hypothetical protein
VDFVLTNGGGGIGAGSAFGMLLTQDPSTKGWGGVTTPPSFRLTNNGPTDVHWEAIALVEYVYNFVDGNTALTEQAINFGPIYFPVLKDVPGGGSLDFSPTAFDKAFKLEPTGGRTRPQVDNQPIWPVANTTASASFTIAYKAFAFCKNYYGQANYQGGSFDFGNLIYTATPSAFASSSQPQSSSTYLDIIMNVSYVEGTGIGG